MALAGNTGNNPIPDGLCTSPDTRRNYSSTKICRGNPYTYPTNGHTDAADSYTDSPYTDSYPTDCYAYASYTCDLHR